MNGKFSQESETRRFGINAEGRVGTSDTSPFPAFSQAAVSASVRKGVVQTPSVPRYPQRFGRGDSPISPGSNVVQRNIVKENQSYLFRGSDVQPGSCEPGATYEPLPEANSGHPVQRDHGATQNRPPEYVCVPGNGDGRSSHIHDTRRLQQQENTFVPRAATASNLESQPASVLFYDNANGADSSQVLRVIRDASSSSPQPQFGHSSQMQAGGKLQTTVCSTGDRVWAWFRSLFSARGVLLCSCIASLCTILFVWRHSLGHGWDRVRDTIEEVSGNGSSYIWKSARNTLFGNRPQSSLPIMVPQHDFSWAWNYVYAPGAAGEDTCPLWHRENFGLSFILESILSYVSVNVSSAFVTISAIMLLGTPLLLAIYLSYRVLEFIALKFYVLAWAFWSNLSFHLWVKSTQGKTFTPDLFTQVEEVVLPPIQHVQTHQEGLVKECFPDAVFMAPTQSLVQEDLLQRYFESIGLRNYVVKEEVSSITETEIPAPRITPEVVIGDFIPYDNWPVGIVRFEVPITEEQTNAVMLQQLGLGFFIAVRKEVYLVCTIHQALHFRSYHESGQKILITGKRGSVELPNMQVVSRGIPNSEELDFIIYKPPQALNSVVGTSALSLMRNYHARCLARVYSFDWQTRKFKTSQGEANIPPKAMLIQHTCSTENGSSGSPLLVMEGGVMRVAGVHIGGLDDEKVNFAFPLGWFGFKSVQQWSQKYSSDSEVISKETEARGMAEFEAEMAAMRALLKRQGLQKYAEDAFGEWVDDPEAGDIFIPGQKRERKNFLDDDENHQNDYEGTEKAMRAAQQALDDYAHEPTGRNMYMVRKAGADLAKARGMPHPFHSVNRRMRKEEDADFELSPEGSGATQEDLPPVVKETLLNQTPPILPPKEKEEEEPKEPMDNKFTELLTATHEAVQTLSAALRAQQGQLSKLENTLSAKAPVKGSEVSGSKKSGKQKPTTTSGQPPKKAPSSKTPKKQKAGQQTPSPNGDGQSAEQQPK